MTSWFDGERIGERMEDIDVNYDQCEEAAKFVVDLIRKIEGTGIPRNRIALGE